MKKYLFAGCGSIGRRHIRNLKMLRPDAQILAYRVRKESLGEFEQECGLHTFTQFEEALNQKPEAVFVTNPTSHHLEIAQKTAEAKIPLFIEKPISDSLDKVDSFIQTCRRNQVLVLLGYKMRFHPSIRLMKEKIEDGTLGDIFSIRSYYGGYLPDWHPWEDYRRMYSSKKALGGGILLDAIHELDYLYWLLGDVNQLKAIGGKISSLDIETEDLVEVLLDFKCGAIGNVHVNYLQQPEYRSCQIVGSKGSLLWDSLKKKVEIYNGQEQKWTAYAEPDNFDPNRMFVDEMRHFLSCLEGNETPIHDLDDAKRVLELTLDAKAIILSEKRGLK